MGLNDDGACGLWVAMIDPGLCLLVTVVAALSVQEVRVLAYKTVYFCADCSVLSVVILPNVHVPLAAQQVR